MSGSPSRRPWDRATRPEGARPRAVGVIGGLAACVAAVALLYAGRVQGGGWAFPLDDAYIHMAVARNVAASGTWGVNPGEFASASSSPAWTLLLAGGFGLVGTREWLPLLVNLVATVAALASVDGWMVATHAWPIRRVVGVMGVTVGAALPVVAALGMEHVLHLVVAVAFARAVVEGASVGRLAVLAGLLPMLRYEALFEVAVAALLLGWTGRRRDAAVIVGTAGAMALSFGLWATAHGADLLPNSLLMKGSLGTGFLTNLAANLEEGAGAVALVAVVALLVPFVAGPARAHGLLFVGTAVLHLGLASVGWYYRYEAYLLAWGLAWLFVAVRALPPRLPARVAVTAAGVATIWLLGMRTFDAVRYFPGRCTYIHDVKVVLAQGLARAAPGTPVALHDIGAMALYGEAVIVDIAGLGTDEVARLAADGRFTGPAIAEVARRRGAVLALATRSWMAADPPPGWEPIAHLEWGLDAERRIEPIVLYALAPGAEAVGRAWLAEAVAHMGGRGAVGEPDQGSGRR